MEIRLRSTGQTITDREFREMYPNKSFPEVLTSDHLIDSDPVFESPAPIAEAGYQTVRDGVTQDERGNWVYAWKFIEKAPDPIVIPTQVTMRQARLQLWKVGKLDAVSAIINALPSPQKEAAQIEWEYALFVERGNGLITELATALSLSDSDLDNLFIGASKL